MLVSTLMLISVTIGMRTCMCSLPWTQHPQLHTCVCTLLRYTCTSTSTSYPIFVQCTNTCIPYFYRCTRTYMYIFVHTFSYVCYINLHTRVIDTHVLLSQRPSDACLSVNSSLRSILVYRQRERERQKEYYCSYGCKLCGDSEVERLAGAAHLSHDGAGVPR